MKKNIQIILGVVFSITVNAQQPVELLFGGLKFKLPQNSKIESNKTPSYIPSVHITWPGGAWVYPTSSPYFVIEYCNLQKNAAFPDFHPPTTAKDAALNAYGMLAFKEHKDVVFSSSTYYQAYYYVFIIETKGTGLEGKSIVSTCYGIKNMKTDSIFFGSYYSYDIKKGNAIIKTIRTTLREAVAQEDLPAIKTPITEKTPVTRKTPVTEKTPTIYGEDKDIIFKKLEGTNFMAALPQYATVESNFNKIMTANYDKVNIMYAVPGIRQNTARDYVYDFLSITFKNNHFPPNGVPENGTTTVTPKFSTYTYMARALTTDKKDMTYCIVGSKSVSGDDYLLSMSFEMSDDKTINQERSNWVMKLVKYFLLLRDRL